MRCHLLSAPSLCCCAGGKVIPAGLAFFIVVVLARSACRCLYFWKEAFFNSFTNDTAPHPLLSTATRAPVIRPLAAREPRGGSARSLQRPSSAQPHDVLRAVQFVRIDTKQDHHTCTSSSLRGRVDPGERVDYSPNSPVSLQVYQGHSGGSPNSRTRREATKSSSRSGSRFAVPTCVPTRKWLPLIAPAYKNMDGCAR